MSDKEVSMLLYNHIIYNTIPNYLHNIIENIITINKYIKYIIILLYYV